MAEVLALDYIKSRLINCLNSDDRKLIVEKEKLAPVGHDNLGSYDSTALNHTLNRTETAEKLLKSVGLRDFAGGVAGRAA